MRRKRFDITFMDIQMPKLDGLRTSRLIRSCEMDDRKKCLFASIDEYLAKPILPERIREILHQFEMKHKKGQEK